VAVIDSIRVYRGVYAGFALAMSEASQGVHFESLPSSDELAGQAFRLAKELIESDARAAVPDAQQELAGVLVCLALIEHEGRTEELTPDALRDGLSGLWALLGGRWSPGESAPVPG